MSYYDTDYAPEDLEVRVSELLIATADVSDPLVDQAVHRVLRLLREQHMMEAAFASEVIDGERVYRQMAPTERAQFIDAQARPLELAYCMQVVNAPATVGCYLSAPVVLSDGRIYGTLYSFSFDSDNLTRQQDLKKLEMAAQLAGRLLNERVRPAAAKQH